MKKQVDPKQLEKTVRELKERAGAYRDYIEGHETRTRVLLIDPLLRALGWDPEAPEEVQLEYKLTAGQPDYALLKGGKPVAVIEAKKLGTRLNQRSPGQVIKYTTGHNFTHGRMVAFTNGSLWVFFRASNGWDPQSVDLAADQTFETAYNLVDCLSAHGFNDPNPLTEPRPVTSDPPKPEGLVPLPNADLDRNPAQIWFEDGSNRPVSSWGKVYAETSRYVVESGLVKPNDYPVFLARRKTTKMCAMNTSPVHPHGKEFWTPVKLREGIWLENGLGSDRRRWQYSIRTLEKFGVAPRTVFIEYEPPPTESAKPPPLP